MKVCLSDMFDLRQYGNDLNSLKFPEYTGAIVRQNVVLID